MNRDLKFLGKFSKKKFGGGGGGFVGGVRVDMNFCENSQKKIGGGVWRGGSGGGVGLVGGPEGGLEGGSGW